MHIRPRYFIVAVLPAIIFASCNSTGFKEATGSADHSEAASVTDSAAAGNVLSLNDPARKLIHTANINCRVKDVYTATSSLETLVFSVGGQVMESHLENQRSAVRMQPYVTDSLRQVQEYTTTSHLTVRVPVRRLDTVLHAVAANADFIESRNLELEDVTFQYIGNKMLNDKTTDLTGEALKRSKKTADVMEVSQYSDERKAEAISRSVENMSIDDKVSYATFTVDLSQPARIDALIIPDTEHLMQPALGQRLQQALHNSVLMVQAVLVFFVTIWPLLVFIALLLWGIRYYSRRSQLRLIRK